MREGSLDAPTRHPLSWGDPDFYDRAKIDAEMQRIFDICHGCRRCFNLCDSFPRLFDLVDNSATGEVDGVDRADYAKVVEACTLCDMCFMTKCPYVPPHEWNVDFPHLIGNRLLRSTLPADLNLCRMNCPHSESTQQAKVAFMSNHSVMLIRAF